YGFGIKFWSCSFHKYLPALARTKIPSHKPKNIWDHKIRKLTPEKQRITSPLSVSKKLIKSSKEKFWTQVFLYELILTFSITCKIIILHPNFVFFSHRSTAMPLHKAFIRIQKHNFSVENKKSR